MYKILAQYVKGSRSIMRKTMYFKYFFKFQKVHKSYKKVKEIESTQNFIKTKSKVSKGA